MLIFQINRIFSMRSRRKKERVRERKTRVPFFFFFENIKNLGRSDDAKRRKQRGWPYTELELLAVLWLIVYPPL